ncbi:amidase [Stella humosa]|uniref:Amidase n=1 Tax=Stella humosa TaxID=94 RepID=A0A3N1LJW4_9PROT|nr:amidase family protein [Stella humosa]ROP91294.1 amidase [Stella humosa]BBK34351.1 6-aminohexanoate-cyclic-dimer hydrolase [Stella humosa]
MPHADDALDLDAIGQADLVRRKEVSPAELVEAAIARIERVNPQVNAVVIKTYERARAAAAGPLDGPFAGVPFLLKDIACEEEGVPLRGASTFGGDYVPTADNELVRRYRAAGLLFLGHTNAPELGIGPTTEPRLYGPARNPWDRERSTGGSSGGAAAAVATGMVAAAHGNDAGGSIRIPAACCGLFGMKPTRARNPVAPHFGDIIVGIAADHVLSRSVRDSAALLDVTAGPTLGDPYWAPPLARAFAEEVGADPRRLRIAFSTRSPIGTPIDPDCVRATEETARLLESLGHTVEEADPAVDGEAFWRAFTAVIAAGVGWALAGLERRVGREATPDDLEPFVWGFTRRAREQTAPQFLLALQDMQRHAREMAGFFVEHDVWLTPTLGSPAVPLGTFSLQQGGDAMAMRRQMNVFAPFTWMSNASGQPAMSVPAGWNEAGLPLSDHFVGRFGDEATLFRLAAQIEAARPWAGRRPPIHA